MENELKTARLAAVEAGREILRYYKHHYEIKEKSYHNPVTDADHAANNRIKDVLLTEFPGYGWLSEETIDSDDRLKRKYVWIVDPLDGTKEFIEGVDNFAVSIALVRDGIPVLGVLYNPATRETMYAVAGQGAFYNDRRVYCSPKSALNECSIVISRSETRNGLWDNTDQWFAGKGHIGSVAYKLGLTAAGKFDIFATLRPKNEWDVAAGHIILREAGGELRNINNGEIRQFNQANPLITPGLVGGNPQLVASFQKLWHKYLKDTR
ncbi:MAG: 3'(2'),5'-bisphosphate nucleotidase CysQ [FCB group bacterium]|nr:3'(2'),5'-bisphosphate nucleotidase CysQ [FCB group bacterium]